jgi:hypothetical protein
MSTYFSRHAVTEGVYVWILMLSDNTMLFIQVLIAKGYADVITVSQMAIALIVSSYNNMTFIGPD